MAAGSVLIAVTAGSGSLVAATAALMAAGTANAPTLITGNALVRLVVPVPNLTEACTWLGVSVFVGIAAGTAAAGLLVDHHGAGAALWASAVAGALVAVLPVAEGVSSSRAESGSRNGGVIVRVFDAERDGGGYGSR